MKIIPRQRYSCLNLVLIEVIVRSQWQPFFSILSPEFWLSMPKEVEEAEVKEEATEGIVIMGGTMTVVAGVEGVAEEVEVAGT